MPNACTAHDLGKKEGELGFDSNFDSGNLDRVSVGNAGEYNLFVNADTNTKGYSQWFYFAVTGGIKESAVTFNILNCVKTKSLFRSKARPMVYSTIEHTVNGVEWSADTFDVSYKKNDIVRNNKGECYHTLSFSYRFKHAGDKVYFAYTRPYTLSRYLSLLKSIKKELSLNANSVIPLKDNELQARIKAFADASENAFKAQAARNQAKHRQRKSAERVVPPERSLSSSEPGVSSIKPSEEVLYEWMNGDDFIVASQGVLYKQETLCKTFGGIPISLITITSSKESSHSEKKVIVLGARVHAGETAGSFKAEAILRFLLSRDTRAAKLRSLYVFKVVPMLNPEGVVCGNFRCALTGVDLNRHWSKPHEALHPQVYYLKNLIRKLKGEGREVLAFCDLHGHDRRLNSFMYGCNRAANGGFCSWTKVRLLPRILAAKSPMFSYNSCRFRVGPSRKSTARVVIWKEVNVTNSFTFESSFFGYTRGNETIPFQAEDYYSLGQSLLLSFLEYHYVLKKLEKELMVTRGWLKPSKLFAVTGILAADALAQRLLSERKEAQRNKRLAQICKAAEDTGKKLHSANKRRELICSRKTEGQDSVGQGLGGEVKSDAGGVLLPTVNVKAFVEASEKGEEVGSEWRDYFAKEELEEAYNQITAGIDPNDKEEESGSESESELELGELQQIIAPTIKVAFA